MNSEAKNRDLAPERQGHVVEILKRDGAARVDELSEALGVSPATVRRDLEALETAGSIRRVHGGAVAVEGPFQELLFDDKASLAAEEKERIAEAAAGLVVAGDTVYLDGGSTVLRVAQRLRDRTDITVVTNSLRAAMELSGGGPRLILVGGELRRLSQTVVGVLTRRMLEHLHFDKAFMGTIGLTLADGLMTTDPQEAFTKHLVMGHSKRVILLADSTKIGKTSFAEAGHLEDIQVLITDRGADQGFVRQVQRLEVEVLEV
jgi:DeoR/GlpR family transcriptional regulator of sugar metabolism